jgi:tetratricopeptide (TPR) repeat protein
MKNSQLGLAPGDLRTLHHSIQLAARGQVQEAAASLRLLHERVPESAVVAIQAAHIMLRLDRYREAHAMALRAGCNPIEPPELFVEAARLLRRFEEPRALQDLVARSNWQAIRSGPLLGEIALLLGSAGLFTQALELVDHACEVDPDYHHVHYLRGALLMSSGEARLAEAHLRRALEIDPSQAHARWLLSMQSSAPASEEKISELRSALEAVPSGNETKAYLAYALHNHLHANGQYEEAWQALEVGNSVKRELVPYDQQSQHELYAALQAMDIPSSIQSKGPSPGTGLIFIVGMHRSGTSLLERVLAGHPDVMDGGESYTVTGLLRKTADHFCRGVIDTAIVSKQGDLDYSEIRQGLVDYASWRGAGRAFLTEKLPSNFLALGFVMRALPEARIIHMKRDPIDTCFSNLRTYFGQAAAYSYNQSDLADYFAGYQRLMAHWHEVAPGRILDVDYNRFVSDPESGAKAVFDYCGLDFHPAALQVDRPGGISATASMVHVRQGILKDRGRAWLPYERYLRPLIEALRSRASSR